MGEIRKLAVAGNTCLAVTTETEGGWRAAGFFAGRPLAVESLATEDEAVWAWQVAALDRLLQQQAQRDSVFPRAPRPAN
jgi:hypothetical protein